MGRRYSRCSINTRFPNRVPSLSAFSSTSSWKVGLEDEGSVPQVPELEGTAKLLAGTGKTLSLEKVQIGSVGFTRRVGNPEWVFCPTQEEIQEVSAIDQWKGHRGTELLCWAEAGQRWRGRAALGGVCTHQVPEAVATLRFGDFPPPLVGVPKSIKIFSSPREKQSCCLSSVSWHVRGQHASER